MTQNYSYRINLNGPKLDSGGLLFKWSLLSTSNSTIVIVETMTVDLFSKIEHHVLYIKFPPN
jgi:hypothetical protein